MGTNFGVEQEINISSEAVKGKLLEDACSPSITTVDLSVATAFGYYQRGIKLGSFDKPYSRLSATLTFGGIPISILSFEVKYFTLFLSGVFRPNTSSALCLDMGQGEAQHHRKYHYNYLELIHIDFL